jgi:hypothetical protein
MGHRADLDTEARGKKFFHLWWYRTPVARSVVGHYTDWATPEISGNPHVFCWLDPDHKGTRWGWVVSVTPRPSFTPGKAGTHRIGGWMGHRADLDTEARGKNSFTSGGIEPRSPGLLVGHYTDWATPEISGNPHVFCWLNLTYAIMTIYPTVNCQCPRDLRRVTYLPLRH